MCMSRGGVGDVVGERIGFGLHQSSRNRDGVEREIVFWLQWCCGCGWADDTREVWVVFCLCMLCVWILCVHGRSRYLYIVLGGYLRILDAPRVNLYRHLLPTVHFANTDLFWCDCRSSISLDITCFYEEQCQQSSESEWPACQRNGESGPLVGVDTICTAGLPMLGWGPWVM